MWAVDIRKRLPYKYQNKKNSNCVTYAVLALMIVLLIIAVVFFTLILRDEKIPSGDVYVSSENSEVLSIPFSTDQQKKVLTVVSYNTKLPKDYRTDLENFGNIKCDSMLVSDLDRMVTRARRDGINLEIIKGYVDKSEQDLMYNEKVSDIMDNKSYTRVRAGVEAKKIVAPGGYSEYQTGLLINFALNGDLKDLTTTKEYMWLNKNCINYGFIQRYKKDKQSRTGMSSDPSCFRYVGVENAKRMRALNMCLEEYTDYIASQQFNLA